MKLKVMALLLLWTACAFASDVPRAMNPQNYNGSSRSLEVGQSLDDIYYRNDLSDIEVLRSLENYDEVLLYIELAVDSHNLDEGLLLDPVYLKSLPKDQAVKLILKTLGVVENELIGKTPQDDEGLKAPNDDEGLKAPADDENL